MAARSQPRNRSWWYRVGWLVLIWAASVAALGIVALVFRLVMSAAGLTTK
jgi:Protein of unknown function (DUF2474)